MDTRPRDEKGDDMAFSDHYPLEAYAAIADVSWWRSSDFHSIMSRESSEARAKGGDYVMTPEFRAKLDAAQKADATDKEAWEKGGQVFKAALKAHLAELRAAGVLKPTGGLAGRDVSMATAWNAYVAGQEGDHRTSWLLGAIKQVLTRHHVRMDPDRHERRRTSPGEHVKPTSDMVEATWSAICASMDAGTSGSSFDGWAIECQDQTTGDRCELHFVGWTAVLMRRTPDHDLEVAPDAAVIPLTRVTFEVPSGRLLLTDTLRVDGFDEAIDFGDDEYGSELSLSSALGCRNRTIAHARKHGFGYCQTTNTTVRVWRNQKTGVIAVVPDDEESVVAGWDGIGSFDCDIWRITAIDETVAEALCGPGSLREHLDGRTDRDDGNIVVADVPTGRWTMHAGEDFGDRMPRHRHGLPCGVKPWCVLVPPKSKKAAASTTEAQRA